MKKSNLRIWEYTWFVYIVCMLIFLSVVDLAKTETRYIRNRERLYRHTQVPMDGIVALDIVIKKNPHNSEAIQIRDKLYIQMKGYKEFLKK